MLRFKSITSPGEVAASQSGTPATRLKGKINVGAACSITVSTPAAKTFEDTDVNTTFEQITASAHGYKTGLKVRLSTTGVLPGGLAAATDYYVIYNDGNVIQLATSAANAAAGTAIDITSAAGGGTHTITPQALSANLVLQASVDKGENYFDLTTTAISASGVVHAAYANCPYDTVRARVVVSGGQLTIGDVYVSVGEEC